jgi:hypothetical protein
LEAEHGGGGGMLAVDGICGLVGLMTTNSGGTSVILRQKDKPDDSRKYKALKTLIWWSF